MKLRKLLWMLVLVGCPKASTPPPPEQAISAPAPIRLHAELPAFSRVEVLPTESFAEEEEPRFLDPTWLGPRLAASASVRSMDVVEPLSAWFVAFDDFSEQPFLSEPPGYLVLRRNADGVGFLVLTQYSRYIDCSRSLRLEADAEGAGWLLFDVMATDNDGGDGAHVMSSPLARVLVDADGTVRVVRAGQ
jgi:hypothetical protein